MIDAWEDATPEQLLELVDEIRQLQASTRDDMTDMFVFVGYVTEQAQEHGGAWQRLKEALEQPEQQSSPQ